MSRYNKEEIDRYFDYNIFAKGRILYLGSHSSNGNEESGIDHEAFEDFIKGLTFLSKISEDPIVIQMNTIGGDWSHGMAIYDIIRACKCHITIIAYGNCCSMGAVIFQAGDNRIISPNCIMMIHDGLDEFSGDAKSFENWAAYSKIIRQKMYAIFLERIKMKKPKTSWNIKRVETFCSHDRILTAQQAIDLGLADEILPLIKIQNKHKEE